MKIKGVILVWNVLLWNFNRDEVIKYNIFSNSSLFVQDLHKEIRQKRVTNYNELRDYISHWSKYNYWSKAEYEIAISGLHSKNDTYEKIDIDYQVQMNLDRITEYVNEKCKLGF